MCQIYISHSFKQKGERCNESHSHDVVVNWPDGHKTYGIDKHIEDLKMLCKFIQPTGKRFEIPMCTVGHWKDGVMIEEWLYWDNATYMKQIGLQ